MTIVIALLLFGIIILIHEFGHFLLAKKNGVTVHEFSIGMGPKIYSREKNGTEYSLRILPIGGYVSMEGEEDGFDRSEEDDDLLFLLPQPTSNNLANPTVPRTATLFNILRFMIYSSSRIK